MSKEVAQGLVIAATSALLGLGVYQLARRQLLSFRYAAGWLALFGLGALSWVATYVGMLELIEANMGDLPILHKVVIGFSVAMLMTMVVWLLDQLFAPNPFVTKLMYGIGYVFLTLISVGFGFGFYWKVLESRSESSRSAESAVTQVQSSLQVPVP